MFHIVLFLGYNNYFSLDDKAVECKRGTLVITSPEQPHDFGPLRPGTFDYHELTFSLVNGDGIELDMPIGIYLANLFGLDNLSEIPAVSECSAEKTKVICDLFQEECNILKESGGKNLSACYRRIFRLLECIVETYTPHLPCVTNKKSRLEKVKKYIDSNYSAGICLNDIADIANLSKYHFCRAFQKEFGVSPKAYQIELRLQAAAQLLRTSGLNCGEIADKLGFSDQYFFSKIFKKRFGVSPKNFETENWNRTGKFGR
ncbi:MAG TPA: AraC family transcriptional regulator [Phycisphaerae bacterium]|nr:AraC family transcriptional regulator [Phycisphaerae bacterium]